MKIGMISFAHMHAYSYAQGLEQLPEVELIGIADDNSDRGQRAAKQFGTKYYESYEQLLKQDLEAVIVTSENVKHAEHVIAAAKAKKHILCEKPIATSLQDARKMIESCNENDVMLHIAFPVRFNPTIQRAKALIEEGKLGDLLAIRGTNRGTNPGGWFIDPALSGGGAVMDHTVHVVDIMRWFLNSELKEVYAEIGSFFSQHPIDDAGILTFEFENGVFATLDCSWSRNQTYPTWGDVTLEIVGSKGTLSLDVFDQNLHIYSDSSGVRRDFWGDDMDAALIKDFVRNVCEQTEPSISGEDGLKATEAALAAYDSFKERKVVKFQKGSGRQ